MRFTPKVAVFAAPLLLTLGLMSCTTTPSGGGGGPTTTSPTSTSTTTTSTVPTAIAIQVAAGPFHTCALLADGTVKCWGQNLVGQLGNTTNIGTPNANPTPTVVAGLTGVTQVAAGAGHTCALLTNGTVTCWGWNHYGQSGNALGEGDATPTAVVGLEGVTQISVGFNYTCALLTNGTVTCWGENSFGQLGTTTNSGTENATPTPTAVDGLTGVTQVSAGDDQTCALLTNGTVTCWGLNEFGQSGNSTNNGNEFDNPTPTTVAGVEGVTQIIAGGGHTCALIENGTVSCWGGNFYGELGSDTNNGTNTANPSPATVAGLTGVTHIAAGFSFTCASLTDRTVTCWGLNLYGELGNPTNSGTENANPTPTAVTGLTSVSQITASQHTCALRTHGTVTCWGDNRDGQLGNTTNNGNENANPTPTAVSGIP